MIVQCRVILSINAKNYRVLFKNAISDERLAEIRAYLQQQRVLG